MAAALALAAPKAAALVRLMASDNDNEALVAVRGLRRILASHGLDLNDFAAWFEEMATAAAPEPEPQPAPKPQPAPEPQGRRTWPQYWFDVAGDLLRRGDGRLDERSRSFLENIQAAARRGRSPSAAQRQWIDDIRAKLKGSI